MHIDPEKQMYGISRQAMVNMVRGNPYQISLGRDNGNVMLAMSILSDAQELLYYEDDPEYNKTAIQFINRAKFVLNQIMEDLNNVPAET